MESYFLSDIHLKSASERNGKILLRFLRSLQNSSSHSTSSHSSLKRADPSQVQIFFLGDIFDLWVSGGQAFIDKYQDLLIAIKDLTLSGVRIVFFEGNHDLHLAPYWENELGVEVYTEARTMDIGGLRVRLEHGDLINLEDVAYLRLRHFLRHPWMEKVGHTIPGWVWLKVGEWLSPVSRKRSASYRHRNEKKLIQMIRHHASRAYQEAPFDLIVTGHMHVRDDFSFQMDGRNVRSINLGSWFEDVKILKICEGQVRWVELTLVQKEGKPKG